MPLIRDFEILCATLRDLNCKVNLDTNKRAVSICSSKSNDKVLRFNELNKIRASILLLPGLLNRFGSVFLPYPGGDKIGSRPLDTHFYILNKFGINVEHSQIGYYAKIQCLKPAELYLPFPSFTGTGMAMMIASKIKGRTIINNASKEPELYDLANLLIKMGVDISGIGTDKITIIGSENLEGAEIKIMDDRLEVGTLILAAIASKGKITLNKDSVKYLTGLLEVLEKAGGQITYDKGLVIIGTNDKLKPISIETFAYPGFPTDLQPQMMALMTQIIGTNMVVENLHDNRFLHVPYLIKMGADISIKNNVALINGVSRLYGAYIEGFDIRGATALIIAALSAAGESLFKGTYHLERGYSNLCENLVNLGADICPVTY